MDIPRGEIIMESPLEFIDLQETLSRFKERGYMEFLLRGDEIEEGYLFLENGTIIGIFYEGSREGEPLETIQTLLGEKPLVVLHKLTGDQMEILKEVYSLDEKYETEIFTSLAASQQTEDVAEGGEQGLLAEWKRKIPAFSEGGWEITHEKDEILKSVDPFVRDILEYVDGKRTIGDIIKESGKSPEDVIGVIEPYKRTGHIKYKE